MCTSSANGWGAARSSGGGLFFSLVFAMPGSCRFVITAGAALLSVSCVCLQWFALGVHVSLR